MKKLLILLLSVFAVCTVYAQQTLTSQDYYEMAVRARQEGNLINARKYLKKVIETSDDDEWKKMAEELYEKIDVFDVSETKLNISPYGDFKDIIVKANGNWTCKSSVNWCRIVEKTGNYIKIWCEENPDYVSRTGFITVSRGDKDLKVEVEQDPGKEKKGRIYFRTQPHNALIETDGFMGFSSSPLVLGIGEFNIKVSKEGYVPKDTFLVINEVSDTTVMVDLKLEPIFGKLKPIIVDQNGNPMQKVDFKIGKTSIDITDYANSHSFDDSKSIVYYGFYNEGVIPLNPAVYEIQVSAKGYQTHVQKVTVNKGHTTEVTVVMKSMMGKLAIVDGGNAAGAKISIPELFVNATVGDTIDIAEGAYDIFVHKSGYKLDNAIKEVEVVEGKIEEYKVRMTRQVNLYVSTKQHGEAVYINGVKVKYQDPYHVITLEEGETYKLEVKKDGYWRYKDEFKVGKDDVLIDRREINLEPVYTLRLKSDELVDVELKRKGDKSGQDFAEGATLSGLKREYTEFQIPEGRYDLVLKRRPEAVKKISHRIAYKGTINVNDSLKIRKIRSWMIPRFGSLSLLDFEYNLNYKSIMSMGRIPVPLRVNFMDFPLTKGLSTSIAEASVVYTLDRTDFPAELPPNHYKVMMPAFSLPFMNYDFRIGGGLSQYFDLSALISYTYYIQFERILSETIPHYSSFMDHFEGHDAFIGFEISSRLKGLNMYLRTGLQYLNGNRCYSYDNSNHYCDIGNYVNQMETVKVNQSMFVINVGFNLGHFGVKRKGHNILRVF